MIYPRFEKGIYSFVQLKVTMYIYWPYLVMFKGRLLCWSKVRHGDLPSVQSLGNKNLLASFCLYGLSSMCMA